MRSSINKKTGFISNFNRTPFLLLGIIAFIFPSCEKSSHDPMVEDPLSAKGKTKIYENVIPAYSEFEPYDENEALDLLQAFHDELQDEIVEDREAGEALWTLEAYLNYELNNIKYQFTSMNWTTEEVGLAIDSTPGQDSVILGSEILAAYNEILTAAGSLPGDEDVYFLDISYVSEVSGIHNFQVDIASGNNTSNEKASGLTYYSSGSYEPVGNSCNGNLATALNYKMQSIYYGNGGNSVRECGTGGRIILSNINTTARGHDNSCCGGGTYSSNLHVYDKLNQNSCVSYGSAGDDGSDNTANGWLNEALWIWDYEENLLSGNRVTIDLVFSDHYKNESGWPHYHISYFHNFKVYHGEIYCSGPFD